MPSKSITTKHEKSKSPESWIWDAACSIRSAKDAPKYKYFLNGTGFERALLINFATQRLDYKRFIQSENHLRPSATSAVHLQSEGEA